MRIRPIPTSYDTFLVTSANLLIETNQQHLRRAAIAPQHERLAAQIDSFREIEAKRSVLLGGQAIKVIGLQELQIDEYHNGETIQHAMDYPFGTWQAHSRKKSGEHIGAVSSVVPDDFDHIPLDHNRYATALWFGDVCVTIVHPIYSDAERRQRQYAALGEHLQDQTHNILMGDFNEEPSLLFRPFGHSSRHKLGSLGLHSVFTTPYGTHPVTLPAPGYAKHRSIPRRLAFNLLGGGMQYDDIYVDDDMSVRQRGTIDSDSDHRFVYAETRVPRYDQVS